MSNRVYISIVLSIFFVPFTQAVQSAELVFSGKGLQASDVVLRVVTGELNTSDTDITRLKDVEVIVNAANERCLGGGGVDGKVHRAAGRELVAYIQDHFQEDWNGVRCPTGTALATPSFNLSFNGIACIVHAVGPTNTHANKETLLQSAYTESIRTATLYAKTHNTTFKSIAFPSISTGIYGYPVAEASIVALHAIAQEIEKGNCMFNEIRFVVWPDNYTAYETVLKNMKNVRRLLRK